MNPFYCELVQKWKHALYKKPVDQLQSLLNERNYSKKNLQFCSTNETTPPVTRSCTIGNRTSDSLGVSADIMGNRCTAIQSNQLQLLEESVPSPKLTPNLTLSSATIDEPAAHLSPITEYEEEVDKTKCLLVVLSSLLGKSALLDWKLKTKAILTVNGRSFSAEESDADKAKYSVTLQILQAENDGSLTISEFSKKSLKRTVDDTAPRSSGPPLKRSLLREGKVEGIHFRGQSNIPAFYLQ